MRSVIDESRCIGCEVCFVACRDGGHAAIERRGSRIPLVNPDKCVGCGLCPLVCPEACIAMAEYS